jgi:hypothetical protein
MAVSFLRITLLYAGYYVVNDKVPFRPLVLKSCAWVNFCSIHRCVGVPVEHLSKSLCPSIHHSMRLYAYNSSTSSEWFMKFVTGEFWVDLLSSYSFHIHRTVTSTTLHGDQRVFMCTCILFSLLCACALTSLLCSEGQVLSRAPIAPLLGYGAP